MILTFIYKAMHGRKVVRISEDTTTATNRKKKRAVGLMIFLVLRRSLHAFFFGILTVYFPALCAIRCGQPETQPAFFDFKGEATLLIVIGLAAMIRVHSSKLAEPLFQFRIMGLNLN